MKFAAKNQSNQKTPVAYLVQGRSQQYIAFVNHSHLHTLTPKGGGALNYTPNLNYSVGDTVIHNETVTKVFYEGDTLEITF